MKNRGFLLIMLLCLVLAAAPARARTAPGRWALVVGIDRYDSGEITPLEYAESDARVMAATLIRSCGFPRDHVFVLTSSARGTLHASRPDIVAWLVRLRRCVRPGDELLFFFSGHGISLKGKSYLLTADAIVDPIENLELTALNMRTVRALLDKIPAARVLMAVDACRSDPRAGRGTGNNLMTRRFAKDLVLTRAHKTAGARVGPQVTATLYACQVGQRSYEWPDKQQGFFSYFLARGLRGAARDAHGRVTLGSLEAYLDREVPREMRIWRGGADQRPWVESAGIAPSSWVLSGPTADQAAVAEAAAHLKKLVQARNKMLQSEGIIPPDKDATPPPEADTPAPEPDNSALAQAQAAFNGGRFLDPPGQNAVELSRVALQSDPNDLSAKDIELRSAAAGENLAQEALHAKDPKRALAIYQRLFALFPDRRNYLQEIEKLETPPTPDITGFWKLDGNLVTVMAGGQLTFKSAGGFLVMAIAIHSGVWECPDPAGRKFKLVEDTGRVYTLTLSADGQTLDGTDNTGRTVRGVKVKK